MKQYLELLQQIQEKGTVKPAARENMPGTISLFGHQLRHNLADGFPLLTTKEMNFKAIVIELLWFLKGDTNIKYLVDNGVNIWNEDAYNYYLKRCKESNDDAGFLTDKQNILTFEEFIEAVRDGWFVQDQNYIFGDCGYQYGKVWRDWRSLENVHAPLIFIDQIQNVINSLKNNPQSRRHIVTAIDPAHQDDLALYWCHAMFQFNARPLDLGQRWRWANANTNIVEEFTIHPNAWSDKSKEAYHTQLDQRGVPRYYLDCQLYQRSCDVFLGVPYNIASYALLTHIIAEIVGMIPGEYIHTFGDVHIYEDHKEQVKEQLRRPAWVLPKLVLADDLDWEQVLTGVNYNYLVEGLEGYKSWPKIKAKLSTGLK